MNVSERVKDLVGSVFKIDVGNLGRETNFFTELGADSLEMLSFVTAMEKEFGVEVSPEDMEQFYCIENVLKCLASHGLQSS